MSIYSPKSTKKPNPPSSLNHAKFNPNLSSQNSPLFSSCLEESVPLDSSNKDAITASINSYELLSKSLPTPQSARRSLASNSDSRDNVGENLYNYIANKHFEKFKSLAQAITDKKIFLYRHMQTQNTLLHIAVKSNSLEVLIYLLNIQDQEGKFVFNETMVNRVNGIGLTPLFELFHITKEPGDIPSIHEQSQKKDFVEILLSKGASTDNTPILTVFSPLIGYSLLPPTNLFLLMIKYGYLECAELLLQFMSNDKEKLQNFLNFIQSPRQGDGITPIFMMIYVIRKINENNSLEETSKRIFLSKYHAFFNSFINNYCTKEDLNWQGYVGRTPLLYSIEQFCNGVVEILLRNPHVLVNECSMEDNKSPVFMAVDFGNREALSLLLSHPKVDPNIKCTLGVAPIHIAAHYILTHEGDSAAVKNNQSRVYIISLEERIKILIELIHSPFVNIFQLSQEGTSSSFLSLLNLKTNWPNEYQNNEFQNYPILLRENLWNKFCFKGADIFPLFCTSYDHLNPSIKNGAQFSTVIDMHKLINNVGIRKNIGLWFQQLSKVNGNLKTLQLQYISRDIYPRDFTQLSEHNNVVFLIRFSKNLDEFVYVDILDFEHFYNQIHRDFKHPITFQGLTSSVFQFSNPDYDKVLVLSREC